VAKVTLGLGFAGVVRNARDRGELRHCDDTGVVAMSGEDLEREMFGRVLQAAAERKRGAITSDEFRHRVYAEVGRIEQRQWQIVENLRAKAREAPREALRDFAQNLADQLERELREGHGHA
jgi:hypothetical protein